MSHGRSGTANLTLSCYSAVVQTIKIYMFLKSVILSNECEIIDVFQFVRAIQVALQQFTRLRFGEIPVTRVIHCNK